MNQAHLVQLRAKDYISYDGDHFPYQKWLPKKEVKTVIIGLHGISGASSDYIPLAVHSLKDRQDIAVYAPETRGQGRDPILARRGHICDRQEWFNDLYVFTALVRQKHPRARIIWCGESMGSLIALHGYAHYPGATPPCDALILASPIVGIKGEFPKWKENAAKFAAAIFPCARISLESLSGQKKVHVVRDTIHEDQVQKNDYNIARYTFRLLTTLGDMAQKMSQASQTLRVPTLVLHGGQDVFTDPEKVVAFAKNLPSQAQPEFLEYPQCYHLLFHDHARDQVIGDILKWVDDLK